MLVDFTVNNCLENYTYRAHTNLLINLLLLYIVVSDQPMQADSVNSNLEMAALEDRFVLLEKRLEALEKEVHNLYKRVHNNNNV